VISVTKFVVTFCLTAAAGGLFGVFVWPKRSVTACIVFSSMACFVGCCIGSLMSDWMIELGQIDVANRWIVLSICCVPFHLWFMRLLKEKA
jgi:hypothetical protein